MHTIDLAFKDTTRSERPAMSRAVALRLIRATLEAVGVRSDGPVEVAVTLVGEKRMQQLNRTWRRRNRPTDVLAFPLSGPRPKGYTAISLGDIVICPMVVRMKAESSGLPVRAQMAWSLVHGLLHLLGYDHPDDAVGTPKLRRRGEEMRMLEKTILKKLN